VANGHRSDLPGEGKDPAWQPGKGRFLAYATGYSEPEVVWLRSIDGGEARRVADGGFPSWSADGKTLYYHSRRNGKIRAVRVDESGATGPPRDVVTLDYWYPAFSPDGKIIAALAGNEVVLIDGRTGEKLRAFPFPGGGRVPGRLVARRQETGVRGIRPPRPGAHDGDRPDHGADGGAHDGLRHDAILVA